MREDEKETVAAVDFDLISRLLTDAKSC